MGNQGNGGRGQNNNQNMNMQGSDMEGMEEFMRWRMMTEMSEMMMTHMEYKASPLSTSN